MMALLVATALAAPLPWNTDAFGMFGFRPGLGAQVDAQVWRGLWIGGRWSSQHDAYWVASYAGDFDVAGTWHHGLYAGAGWRFTFGRKERWDIDLGLYVGTELSFVRDTVSYLNSDVVVEDRRFYQSWQGGLVFPPTLRFRFAHNHGVVLQGWIPARFTALERYALALGWTARWGRKGGSPSR